MPEPIIDPTLSREPVSSARVPLFIFLLGICLLLPSIWSETSITGSDEYTLSLRTPMEMMEHGQWLTPWLDGAPRLRKPPLLYWATLANYRLFGISLVSARIWGVLAGAGLALCATLLARRLFRTSGLIAGLVVLSTIGVAVQARQALLDLPLACFCGFAMLWWLRWLETGRVKAIASSALMLGLALMTKGPAAIVFFAAGALPAIWLAGHLKPDPPATTKLAGRWLHLILAIGIVLAIALPWPLLMKHLWADHFVRILNEEAAARKAFALSAMSPLSALGGALGLVFPWTLIVLGAIACWFFQKQRTPATTWLIAWFLLSVLPFFFMKSFERYMLAVLPAQAVLCAQWLETGTDGLRIWTLRLSTVLLGMITLALCGFVFWFHLSIVAPVLGLLLATATVWMAFRSRPAWQTIGTAAITLTICLGFVYPRFGIGWTPRELPAMVQGLHAVHFRSSQPAMLSMRLKRSVQRPQGDQIALDAKGNPQEQAVFVEESQFELFNEAVQRRGLHSEQIGSFKTFFSRKAWLRFTRPKTTWDDWKAALANRTLEGLKSEVRIYRVRAKESQ